MKRKAAGRGGRKAKDLRSKKLSVAEQAVVKGGITDGTSNTLLVGEKVLSAAPVRRNNGTAIP